MPTFTVSREEVYDYFRCPKIVAIKVFRKLNQPDEAEGPPRRQPEVPASVIGKIGEAAVVAAFSPAAAVAKSVTMLKEAITSQTRDSVVSMGVVVDANAARILEETTKGIAEVRASIVKEFGDVQVIGRGGCKNGPFPGEALPDFVVTTPKHREPILVEVKNTSKPVRTDHFQASFYNTVARETGVVVHEQRFETGKLNLTPIAYHQSIAETLLVYPRGGTFERVTDKVELGEDTIKKVWQAKQLGFLGKSPHTDCDSKCPHHRMGFNLPEGDLEVVKPLPLIFAKGMIEAGTDLDTNYLHHYFYKSGIGNDLWQWTFEANRDQRLKEEVVKRLASKFDLPADLVEKMAFRRERIPDPKDVLKAMSGDVEPWGKMLGAKQMRHLGPTLQGLVTRVYSLPQKSEEFVKQSQEKWR